MSSLAAFNLVTHRRARCIAILAAAVISLVGLDAHAQPLTVGSDLVEELTVTEGATYERQIPIQNNSDSARTVSISLRDFSASGGGSSYPSPGSISRSNASWIDLQSSAIVIPPNSSQPVTYRITVPEENTSTNPDSAEGAGTFEGTYWSVIMIEEGNPTTRQRGIVQISHRYRYAVKIITHIQNSGSRTVDLQGTKVSATDSTKTLRAILQHTGTRVFRPEVYLELYDQSGGLTGRFPAPSQRLYPETTTSYSIPIDSVQSGSYTGMLVIDGGEDALFGAQLNLDL